jgi:hypothetical protein
VGSFGVADWAAIAEALSGTVNRPEALDGSGRAKGADCASTGSLINPTTAFLLLAVDRLRGGSGRRIRG